MYFQMKSTLKNKHNHFFKLARSELFLYVMMMIAHPPYDGDSNFMELANLQLMFELEEANSKEETMCL